MYLKLTQFLVDLESLYSDFAAYLTFYLADEKFYDPSP